MSRPYTLFFVLVASLAGACDQTPSPKPSVADRPVEAAGEGEPKAKGVVDAPARVDHATYRLSLAPIEGAAEAEQAFEVSLAGVGEWHVNTDYPISVSVAADEGLGVSKTKLDKSDAAELSDDVARFVFVARSNGAAPGGRVNAHVKFAMCTPGSCTFHDETVGLDLGRD